MTLQSVPGGRPPAADLIDHDDKRIARAAQKVMAAEQGYEVAPSGQIPKAIMADYLNATSGGAA